MISHALQQRIMSAMTAATTTKVSHAVVVVRRQMLTTMSRAAATWSQSLSFGSPESDFTATRSMRSMASKNDDYHHQNYNNVNNWSRQLSFTSPEADFTSVKAQRVEDASTDNDTKEWSEQLSFASPESDFTSGAASSSISSNNDNNVMDHDKEENLYFQDFLSSSFLCSPESALGGVALEELLDDTTKRQWRRQRWYHDSRHPVRNVQEVYLMEWLPGTLSQAMDEHDTRAIVVTTATAPFDIVHVNAAWESLCGYTKQEVVQEKKRLSVLQGPLTNRDEAQHLLQDLQQGHAASTILTNYTKQGRPFTNLVRVAPLYDPRTRRMTHFVGVLEEVVSQYQQQQQEALYLHQHQDKNESGRRAA